MTFGGLAVEVDGKPYVALATQRKALVLLALLAAHGPRGISRDRLVAYLWPDGVGDAGRNALAQLLHRVRREVGADGIVGNGELRLDHAVVSSDVAEFKAAMEEGDAHTAVSLYRGDFLEGVHLRIGAEVERWEDAERRALKESCARALERLARNAESRADMVAVVDWRRRSANLDPLNARAALQYMDALVAAGNREAAIRHAMVHAAVVRAELEAEPDQAVVARAEALRAVQRAPGPADSPSPVANEVSALRSATADASAPASSASMHVRSAWRRPASVAMAIAALALVAVVVAKRNRVSDPAEALPVERAAPPSPDADVRIRRPTTSTLVRTTGSVSRDGRYFYAGTGNGSQHLTRIELATGRIDTIARFDGALDNVRVSPDGKQIAATVWIEVLPTERQTFFGPTLWVVGADGSNKRLVARPNFLQDLQPADWTPDSRGILVLAQRDSGKGETYVALVSATHGTMQNVAEIGPAWPWRTRMSPDGRYIAYTDRELANEHTRVKVMNVASGVGSVLVPAAGDEQLLDWTSDGNGVFFTRQRNGMRNVWLQPVADGRAVGEARMVKADVGIIASVGVTADGQLHYVAGHDIPGRQSTDVIVVDLDSATLRDAAPKPVAVRAVGGTTGGVYSPDGKYLAYTARHGLDGIPGTATLVIQTLDGNEIREIPLAVKRPIVVNWTSDARRLLMRGDGSRGSEGFLIAVATGSVDAATHYNEPPWITLGRPAVLADGSVLRGLRDSSAADRWQEADNKVVRLDQASGRDEVIGTVHGMVRMVPSPDGKAFVAVVQDGDAKSLHLYSIDRGRMSFVRRLAPLTAPHSGRDATGAIWGPGNTAIVLSIDMGVGDGPPMTRVMRYPLSGAPAEHLFDIQDRAMLNSVHRDGRRFAFLRTLRPSWELWAMASGGHAAW